MVIYKDHQMLSYPVGGLDNGLLHVLEENGGKLPLVDLRFFARRDLKKDDHTEYKDGSVQRALWQLRKDRHIQIGVEYYVTGSNDKKTKLSVGAPSLHIKLGTTVIIMPKGRKLEAFGSLQEIES